MMIKTIPIAPEISFPEFEGVNRIATKTGTANPINPTAKAFLKALLVDPRSVGIFPPQ